MTSPTPTRGPCLPWDTSFCVDLPAGSAAISGNAALAATEILYNMTGQQFSICEFTVRPCRQSCWGNSGPYGFSGWWEWQGFGAGSYMWPVPWLYNGMWMNLTCGQCPGECSCTPLEKTILPSPIASITSVKLNGQTMPASAYRVDNFRELIRTDGGMWPICQDMNLPDTANNTWSVTFKVGQAVPQVGLLAVAELTSEIAKGCVGLTCTIPANLTQMVRQGITIDFTNFTDLLEHGLLGLRWCDIFISTYNPNRLKAAPYVYDVDGPGFRRTNT